MKKFVFRLMLFLALFFIYDKLFLAVLVHLSEEEYDRRVEMLIKGQLNKDIIVLGSSRGSRDIIAGQIEDQTGLSTFNLSYNGSGIEFHEYILNALVSYNDPPDILLLVVDDSLEFLETDKLIFRKDRLYPLVKYPFIWKEISERDGTGIMISRFLVLNRLNLSNFHRREQVIGPLDSIFHCGSMPISQKSQEVELVYNSGQRSYSKEDEMSEKIISFINIIIMCKNNGIIPVIVFPPNFQNHSKTFENRIRDLIKEDAQVFVYDTNKPIYRNGDFFFNEEHLLRKGATVFTNEIVEFLNGITDAEY